MQEVPSKFGIQISNYSLLMSLGSNPGSALGSFFLFAAFMYQAECDFCRFVFVNVKLNSELKLNGE